MKTFITVNDDEFTTYSSAIINGKDIAAQVFRGGFWFVGILSKIIETSPVLIIRIQPMVKFKASESFNPIDRQNIFSKESMGIINGEYFIGSPPFKPFENPQKISDGTEHGETISIKFDDGFVFFSLREDDIKLVKNLLEKISNRPE